MYFLNSEKKCFKSLYPTSSHMTGIVLSVSCSIFPASSQRVFCKNLLKVIPVYSFSNMMFLWIMEAFPFVWVLEKGFLRFPINLLRNDRSFGGKTIKNRKINRIFGKFEYPVDFLAELEYSSKKIFKNLQAVSRWQITPTLS